MTVYDVLKGISQIVGEKGYDGAKDEDGEYIKIGLKREEGNPLIDSRIMDGFGVKFSGDKMIVTYHGQCTLKDVHKKGPKNFEDEMERMFDDITKFLKKEFRKAHKTELNLTAEGDADSIIQRMNNIRTWVQSKKVYKIGNIKDAENPKSDEQRNRTIDDKFKKFLELGGKKEKPKNVTAKND